MKREGLEPNTSNKKLFKFDFDHSPQSINSPPKKKMISRLQNSKIKARKMP